MKKIRFFAQIVILAVSLTTVSCDFFGGSKNQNKLEHIDSFEQLEDTIRKILVDQDSLYAGLVDQINTMTVALQKTDSNCQTLEKQVSELREPARIWNFLTLGCVIAIICILGIVLYLLKNFMDKEKVSRYVRKHSVDEKRVIEILGQINIQDLKKKLDQISSTSTTSKKASTTTSSSEILELSRRIKVLEDQISKSSMHNTFSQPKDNNMPSVSYNRMGYANTNSKNYFLDISDTKQEASVYQIKFQSDTTGLFDIISLDKIKSRNDWQDVIEAQGDCLMQEANRYERLEYGACKKVESSSPTWEVTKKLKIRIHK